MGFSIRRLVNGVVMVFDASALVISTSVVGTVKVLPKLMVTDPAWGFE